MTPPARPELLILQPAEPSIPYTNCIRQFVDAGVLFPFDDEFRLPSALPEDLTPLRCIVMDPARKGEIETGAVGERLNRFRREGGLVWFPDMKMPAGGTVGDSVARHSVMRIINAAGLRMNDPAMAARMLAIPEEKLIAACKGVQRDELDFYQRSGNAFGDPVTFCILPAAIESAEFFGDPALAEPAWEHMDGQVERFFAGTHGMGGVRWIARYAERRECAGMVDRLRRHLNGGGIWTSLWRVDGVYINCDISRPADCDPDDVPARLRTNAWTWPETAASIGDANPVIARLTGDDSILDDGLRHIRGAHRWLFAADKGLYYHVGRPDGPDRRSVPWGRGNCWFLAGVDGMLDEMPAAHPARAELAEMLRLELDGLLRVQCADGMWLNVLDGGENSRPCSSVTSRLVEIYGRAYWKGWLRDERIPPMIERAWRALRTKVWEYRGIGNCVGTSHGLERQTYLARPGDYSRVSRSSFLLSWMALQKVRSC